MINRQTSRKGQVAIFIIVALVIVGGIITYFAVRNYFTVSEVPVEFKPIYNYYQACIENEIRGAIDLAGSQGGHIYVENYAPGSQYAPFSSQLNFLGFPVPYWYYVSGNGLIKENVPTKADMQNGISRFVKERLNRNCNLNSFYEQGYTINVGEPTVTSVIQDNSVIVDVNADVVASRGEGSARKTTHHAEITSKFGSLYNTAKEIYDYELSSAVLENYSVDALRLYAPVDGVEISCSGKVWKTREVVDGFKSALEGNIGAIKFKGDYYTLSNPSEKYFVVNLPVDNSVNLIYSKNWPTKIEIAGADNELMIANPIGTQGGLGVMGFCYSPYHFVYDVSFPVMIQIYNAQEVFQFPVVVVIDKNMARNGIPSQLSEEPETPDVCQYKTQDITVNTYDNELNRIDANLSYLCFTQQCFLGSTQDGVYSGKAPACINGYLKADAGGYAEKRQLFSTNEESSLDVILDREYDVELELEVGGEPLKGTAIVIFENGKTTSTALPDSNRIKLSEGLYNVTVYAYGNSSIEIAGSTKKQCYDVSSGGIFGLFGGTKQECTDISIPSTKIDSALIGGGKSEIYILPSDLQKGKIKLRVDSLPTPNSIEKLQSNYEAFGGMGVELALD